MAAVRASRLLQQLSIAPGSAEAEVVDERKVGLLTDWRGFARRRAGVPEAIQCAVSSALDSSLALVQAFELAGKREEGDPPPPEYHQKVAALPKRFSRSKGDSNSRGRSPETD